jgi:hypothetical protein
MKAPAPWQLSGRAYIGALALPEQQRMAEAGTPERLGRPGGRLSTLMFVDYEDSNVGPYYELLFIPGHFPFADGRRHPSIGRIYVSSQASVDNGRANWGIPKDRADFRVYREAHQDRVEVSQNGQVFARLTLRHRGPSLPVPGGLIPSRWRTLGQVRDGQTFLYAPKASGWLSRARLAHVWADGEHFPAIQHGKVRGTGYLSGFDMTFPEARILPDSPDGEPA